MSKQRYRWKPDFAVPPSATIKALMDEKGLSQADLATRLGLTNAAVNKMLNKNASLTHEVAISLERVLGLPASFWAKRESDYRHALIRGQEEYQLQENTDWLKSLPVRELQKRGVIDDTSDKTSLVVQLLTFFGVTDLKAFKATWVDFSVQFRGADRARSKVPFVAAWLRLGELAGEKAACAPYDKDKFLAALKEVRGLTRDEPVVAIPKAVELCANAGVAVCVVRQIPGASISGAARWISPNKALIQLSFKYKTDDQFWFTFFHEACHILKHAKKAVYLEDGTESNKAEESEANQFARDFLIPKQYAGQLPHLRSKQKIKQFALALGISPGVVVGRLQHDALLEPSFCNNLKKSIEINF